MRALLLVTCFAVFSCGKSGPADAGAPVCLEDFPDASVPADAGLDFSCRGGHSHATGGQAEFVVTGTVDRAGFSRTPFNGIQVELVGLDGTVLASTVSADGGHYRLAFDAQCAALDGEVRATHPSPDAGFYRSYAVPEAPWRNDRDGLDLVLFDDSTRGLAAALASVTLTDGTAVLALTVTDCNGNPVEGALVSTVGGVGDVRYVTDAGLPSSTQAATGPGGDAIVFNVPGSSVEVVATSNGAVVGQRVVPVHPNAATGTFLAP